MRFLTAQVRLVFGVAPSMSCTFSLLCDIQTPSDRTNSRASLISDRTWKLSGNCFFIDLRVLSGLHVTLTSTSPHLFDELPIRRNIEQNYQHSMFMLNVIVLEKQSPFRETIALSRSNLLKDQTSKIFSYQIRYLLLQIYLYFMPCCAQGFCCFKLAWYNTCGSFAGISCAIFCASCLVAAPAQMLYTRGRDCCLTGCNQGLGTSCICSGNYFFLPDWLKRWSIWHSVGEERGKIFDIQIVNTIPDTMRDDIKERIELQKTAR